MTSLGREETQPLSDEEIAEAKDAADALADSPVSPE